MTLYELRDEFIDLMDLAENEELDQQTLADTIEALTGEIEDKAEGWVCVIKELEADADKLDKEIKRLTVRKSVAENNAKRMKNTLMMVMEQIGMTKLPTEHFKLSVAGNGGQVPIIWTSDDIPDEYTKVIREKDTDKVRAALKLGELPFAKLGERGKHLSIR